MIEAMPLRPEHLRGFMPDEPVPMEAFPPEQYGHAIAVVEGGVTLAVCGGWLHDGVVTLALLLTADARKRPITLHKMVRQFIRGLHNLGHERIRTLPRDNRSARWLRSLGFYPTEQGAFFHDRH